MANLQEAEVRVLATILSDSQAQVLMHTLGDATMYRNYFACHKGEEFQPYVVIRELIDLGLMVEGRTVGWADGMTYFHVTESGKGVAAVLFAKR